MHYSPSFFGFVVDCSLEAHDVHKITEKASSGVTLHQITSNPLLCPQLAASLTGSLSNEMPLVLAVKHWMWAASIGYIQPPISLSRSYSPQSLNLSHHVPYLTGRDSAPDARCPRYWILQPSRICFCIHHRRTGRNSPTCSCSACTSFVNLGETFHSFLSSGFSPCVNPWVLSWYLDHTVSSSASCSRHEQPPSHSLNSWVLRHLKCKDYSNLNNEPTAEGINLCLHTIIASFLSLFFKSNHVLSAKKVEGRKELEPWKFRSFLHPNLSNSNSV